MAVDVSYTVPAGRAVNAGRFAVASVASFAAQLNSITGNVTAAPAPAPSPGPAPSAQPFRVVRTGTRYATLLQALAGIVSGDTITVSPGTYVIPAEAGEVPTPGKLWTPFGINVAALTIEWEVPGQRPVIDMSAFALAQGTSGGRPVGILAGGDCRSLTVRGLEIIGNFPGDSYGIESQMGYYYGVPATNPAATLTVEYCKIKNFSDGVKTSDGNENVTVYLTANVIEDCSANDLTHGVYFSAINEVVARGNIFRNTADKVLAQQFRGHLFKSRARVNTIEGNLFDPVGGCACSLEFPNGGTVRVRGNIILHYGAASNSNENPPIKYGAEQQACWIDVTLSGSISAGQTITCIATGASGLVTNVQSGGTRIVFIKTSGGTRFEAGDTVSVGGVTQATVVSRGGSPDGIPTDGGSRTHSLTIAQNTVRKTQPTWAGFADIPVVWASTITDDANNVLFTESTLLAASTIRNNILAGEVLGSATLLFAPNNSAVALSTVSDLGVYSGGVIDGSPAVNDAPWAFVAAYTLPAARTDTKRGGLKVADPAWRVGLTANTWSYIGSSTLASLDPEDNPAINGISGNAAWHGTDGQTGMIDGWSGATWDESTGEYAITGQGGHNNYGGNEGYAINLAADAPAWRLYRLPSGRLPNTTFAALIDGQDATGVYSIDGEPRSTHGYGNSLVVPGLGPMLVRLGSTYPASAQSNKCWVFDTATGASNMVFEANASSLGSFPGGTGLGFAFGACCYVPARGANPARIYACGSGSNCWLWYANVGARNATWTGAKIGSGNLYLYGTGGYGGMVYIPSLDRILSVSWNGSALEFVLIHPDTAATTTLSLSGAVASGFFAAGGRFGFDWAPDLGKLLLWNNVTNRAQISTATPNPGSELTAWTLGTLTVAPSNSITPRAVYDGSSGPWQGAGTLLRYSQRYGGLMLASEVGQPLMFYATR